MKHPLPNPPVPTRCIGLGARRLGDMLLETPPRPPQGEGWGGGGAYRTMKYAFEERRVICKGDYWIAPDAVVIGSVVLEPNASIWFGCIVRGDDDTITIGENSQLQDGCVLHVDAGFPVKIGRNVSVGHMAMLHGCTIGDGSLIGIKAVVLNGAKVGKNCLIGANALIAEGKEIPDGSLVIGSPGKVVRKLSEEEMREIVAFSDHYVREFKRYRESFTPDGA